MRLILPLLLSLLSACSVDADPKRSAAADTLIRLTDSDARGLDPQMVSDLASIRIAADQFEGLTRFNAAGQAEAGLAESWMVSNDGKAWTFRLRDRLRFSDGTPIEAKVFVHALARIHDSQSGSPHGALFDIIEAIKAPDKQTVVIRLTNPFPELPALLAHPAIAALPFHRIERLGDKWTSDRPLVTSGAYHLTNWKLNQQLLLETSPHWHGGRPLTAKLIWRPIDNMNSAMRLVLAGAADIGSDYPPARHHWLKAHYPQLVRSHPFLGTYYFAFNTRKAPFNDVRVRRALAMAVDRDWVAKEMVDAGNEPAWGILPPGLCGGKAALTDWARWPRAKRMDEARKLLGAAGFNESRPLSFEIRFNSSTEHRRAAVAMATMWRELGVDARLLNSESSLHFDSLKRADFQFARSGWIADLPAPENFLAVHRSDAGAQNYSGYANPAYDAALDAALAEPDPAKRAAKMRSVEAMLIRDMPILPLYHYASRALVRPNVTGWLDNASHVHPSRTLGVKRS
jgi:peptide/nickel transport system substrate-binding protein/oligopeptide transport system substrate-binding protein